ncbi:hypothetical protein OF83DRAFT_1179971 [Amylostereum chailletii]|nr:hypothetical protein OF83DRAFT_1179971 [Amylostereum chailletii]
MAKMLHRYTTADIVNADGERNRGYYDGNFEQLISDAYYRLSQRLPVDRIYAGCPHGFYYLPEEDAFFCFFSGENAHEALELALQRKHLADASHATQSSTSELAEMIRRHSDPFSGISLPASNTLFSLDRNRPRSMYTVSMELKNKYTKAWEFSLPVDTGSIHSWVFGRGFSYLDADSNTPKDWPSNHDRPSSFQWKYIVNSLVPPEPWDTYTEPRSEFEEFRTEYSDGRREYLRIPEDAPTKVVI